MSELLGLNVLCGGLLTAHPPHSNSQGPGVQVNPSLGLPYLHWVLSATLEAAEARCQNSPSPLIPEAGQGLGLSTFQLHHP